MSVTYAPKDLVTKKITYREDIPESWNVPQGHFLQLSLKMCQLSTLRYGFRWFNDRVVQPAVTSLIDQPSKILHLDISVNDLKELDYDGLLPFKNLRSLNASINRIYNYYGIEILKHLRIINLSHNSIMTVVNLGKCKQLSEAYLSVNKIYDITDMPRLSELTILHIDHNELESIDGVQVLVNLKELFVQKNRITTLVPLVACTRLRTLNAAHNMVKGLRETCEAFRTLKKLEIITLEGNPMTADKSYVSAFLEVTNIAFLDGSNVRIPNTHRDRTLKDNVQSIAEVAQQIHQDQLEREREHLKEDIMYLQQKIISRQEEYEAYEEKVKKEMYNCVDHLSHLPQTFPDVVVLPSSSFKPASDTTHPSKYGIPLDMDYGKDTPRRPDYSGIKNTDDLLRHAFNELTMEQNKKDDFDLRD